MIGRIRSRFGPTRRRASRTKLRATSDERLEHGERLRPRRRPSSRFSRVSSSRPRASRTRAIRSAARLAVVLRSAAARRPGPSSAQYAPGDASYGMPTLPALTTRLPRDRPVELHVRVAADDDAAAAPASIGATTLVGRRLEEDLLVARAGSRGRRAIGPSPSTSSATLSGERGERPRSCASVSCAAHQSRRARRPAPACPGEPRRRSGRRCRARSRARSPSASSARASRAGAAPRRGRRRETIASTRSRSTSASTASSAGRFPWTS